MEFDLAKVNFPSPPFVPSLLKSAIKEMLWIYQDQSNSLDCLEENTMFITGMIGKWETAGRSVSAMELLSKSMTLRIRSSSN